MQCFILKSDRKPVWGHDCSTFYCELRDLSCGMNPWHSSPPPQHRGRVGLCLQHPWQKISSWSSFLLALGRRPQQCQPTEGSSSAHQNAEAQYSRLENVLMITGTGGDHATHLTATVGSWCREVFKEIHSPISLL